MTPTLSQAHKNLIQDLRTIASQTVRKRGRRLRDLCFAKRPSQGDAFFINMQAETPWDIWEEIVHEVSQLHPHYPFAFVVDVASELFNQEEEVTPVS